MTEQRIAVAALGALHPGDVVVEGYRPEPVPICDGHGFVVVRREIPDPLPTEQQRVAADVLRQVGEVYVGGGAAVRADLRAGIALIAHRYGIEVPS